MLPTPCVSCDSDMTSAVLPSNWLQDVGNRFSPSDFLLIDHYLYSKMAGNDDLVKRIPTMDVYDYDPWELPQHSRARSNDTEFYFFCPRDLNGGRIKRKTKAGYWKSGGNDTKVKNEKNGEVIAKKKHLVFYTGRTPRGKRTGWTMHEYTSVHNLNQMTFVLIKLWKKPDPARDDDEASGLVNYDHKNGNPDKGIDFSPVTSGEVSPHMGFDFSCNATPSEEGVVSTDMNLDSMDQTPYPTSDNSTSYEGDSSRLVTSENLLSDVMFSEMIDLEPPLSSLEWFQGYNAFDYSLNHVLGNNMHVEKEAVSDSGFYSDLWSPVPSCTSADRNTLLQIKY